MASDGRGELRPVPQQGPAARALRHQHTAQSSGSTGSVEDGLRDYTAKVAIWLLSRPNRTVYLFILGPFFLNSVAFRGLAFVFTHSFHYPHLKKVHWRTILNVVVAVSSLKFSRARRASPHNVSAITNKSVDIPAADNADGTLYCHIFFLRDADAMSMRRHNGHRHGSFQSCQEKKSPAKIFSKYHL